MQMIHGDALNIAMTDGEALIGFDRIYIGASVSPKYLSKLRSLLKIGGVLVGPVGDELMKITRIKRSSADGENSTDFSPQVLSGVRFTALLEVRSSKTLLPSRVWSPSVHQTYPEAFRKSSKELLLCSHAPFVQPIPTPHQQHRLNMAATLPRVIWLEILSFTHPNWFELPQSEECILRQRLSEEQENSRNAHAARVEAEARCHAAERERDVFRLLARRWQSRLLLLQQNRTDNDTVGDEMLALHGRESGAIFGLGAMLRGFHSDDSSSESDDDEDEQGGHEMDVEETNEDGQDEADFGPDDDNDDDDDDENYIFSDEEVEEEGMSLTSSPTALFVKRQVRTVSVSEDV